MRSQRNINRLQILFELHFNYTGDATVGINENAKHMACLVSETGSCSMSRTTNNVYF